MQQMCTVLETELEMCKFFISLCKRKKGKRTDMRYLLITKLITSTFGKFIIEQFSNNHM